jgi:hypothetical protein
MEGHEMTHYEKSLAGLAFVGWVMPIIGLAWGTGAWWLYVIWLLVGTVVLFAYQLRQNP